MITKFRIAAAALLIVALRVGADGRRVSLYSGSHLLAETAASDAVQPPIEQEYVWFGERPVAQFDNAGVRYTAADHVSTPLLQTASNGTVVWRVEMQPYGGVHQIRSGAAVRQPLRFPGQIADETTGDRAYNVHRWYNADRGRYTQADPIALDGGPNLYAYARQNPTRYIDPTGLITYDNFPSEDVQRQVENAVEQLKRKVRECPTCLTRLEQIHVETTLDHPEFHIIWNPSLGAGPGKKNCGYTPALSVAGFTRTVEVGPDTKDCCGGFAATLLHEIWHIDLGTDAHAYGLENRCYGCPIPPPPPPPYRRKMDDL